MSQNTRFTIILGILLLGLLLMLALGIILRNQFQKPETTIDLTRANVIKEIEKLGRLETASYSIEKIIEAGNEGNFLQDILYGDRILLIAHGKVVAGVDLEEIEEQDVNVEEKTLSITLPPPTIFSSTLDSEKTSVYDRTQGILRNTDKDLESEARQAAEGAIYQAACDGGILIDAKENAVSQITDLFEFAGFTEITVTIPDGQC